MTSGAYVSAIEMNPDADGDPPVPTVVVGVGRAYRETPSPFVNLRASLDTGSGPTVVSEAWLRDLDPDPTFRDERQCVTFDGSAVYYPVYWLEILIADCFAGNVAAVVMPIRARLVLGRDVLNRLRITLDAAANRVELENTGRAGGP